MVARLVAVAAAFALATSVVACGGSEPVNPLAGIVATPGEGTVWIVLFGSDPDLSAAAGMSDWSARGRFVVDELLRLTEETQADARRLLDEAGIEATSYWAVDAMAVVGPDELGDALTRLPGVTDVYAEPLHQQVAPPGLTPVAPPTAVPASVSALGVPEVWAAGNRGGGVTVGFIDSGVDGTHPALAGSYAGVDGAGTDDDHHWFDATGTCPDAPCDDEGHGTHVAGIVMAGGTATSTATGIAPDARWIAAKACSTGEGCSVRDLLEAAQFMLAPTTRSGTDPDPARRPQVLNNSWELDHLDGSVDRLVAVWEAAGIVPVFAAGNTGPDCASVGEPSSVDAALSVGAVDGGRTVLASSGRGPGVDGVVKPDVVAPGEAIVSTVPGGRWAEASGTSAAAPHVTGLVALALAAGASPDQVDDHVLRSAQAIAADGCGTSGQPNDVTGWGFPDAPALLAASRPG